MGKMFSSESAVWTPKSQQVWVTLTVISIWLGSKHLRNHKTFSKIHGKLHLLIFAFPCNHLVLSVKPHDFSSWCDVGGGEEWNCCYFCGEMEDGQNALVSVRKAKTLPRYYYGVRFLKHCMCERKKERKKEVCWLSESVHYILTGVRGSTIKLHNQGRTFKGNTSFLPYKATVWTTKQLLLGVRTDLSIALLLSLPL